METTEQEQKPDLDHIKALIEYRLKVARMAPELLDGLRHATKQLISYSKIMGLKLEGQDYLIGLVAKAEDGDPNHQPLESSILMPGQPGLN